MEAMKMYTEKTNTKKTTSMKKAPKKTDNRSYCNLIDDTVMALERQASNPNVATDEMMNDYAMYFLLSKCEHSSQEGSRFEVVGVRYDDQKERLYGFSLKMNLDDADIVIRVSNLKGKARGILYLGKHYSRLLSCPNGAYPYILDQLYDCAAGVRIAA